MGSVVATYRHFLYCGASHSVATSMYRKHTDNVYVLQYSIYSPYGVFIGVGMNAQPPLKLLTEDILLALMCSMLEDQEDSECLQFREDQETYHG